MTYKVSVLVVFNHGSPHYEKNSESIKLKQKTVEKWILSQAIEDLLELYVSMSKDGVPEVVPKHTEVIYLAHGEDDQ